MLGHAAEKSRCLYKHSAATAEEALRNVSVSCTHAIERNTAASRQKGVAAEQSQSKPPLASLHGMAGRKNETLSKKSRLGEAFAYVLNRGMRQQYWKMAGRTDKQRAAERGLHYRLSWEKNFIFFGSATVSAEPRWMDCRDVRAEWYRSGSPPSPYP